jgi:hypothetical protein
MRAGQLLSVDFLRSTAFVIESGSFRLGARCSALKAHNYFDYQVDPKGKLRGKRKEQVIQEEGERDGWYLLHINLPQPDDRGVHCPRSNRAL